jgi:hypothetical protein
MVDDGTMLRRKALAVDTSVQAVRRDAASAQCAFNASAGISLRHRRSVSARLMDSLRGHDAITMAASK